MRKYTWRVKHKCMVRKVSSVKGFPWRTQCYDCSVFIYTKEWKLALDYALKHRKWSELL